MAFNKIQIRSPILLNTVVAKPASKHIVEIPKSLYLRGLFSSDFNKTGVIGIWSGIGMIRNTNSRIKINNTATQKESTPNFNVENPKIGKNHGNLGFQNKFTNF